MPCEPFSLAHVMPMDASLVPRGTYDAICPNAAIS